MIPPDRYATLGVRLVTCPACGYQCPEGYHYCPACGVPLGAPEPVAESRRARPGWLVPLLLGALIGICCSALLRSF